MEPAVMVHLTISPSADFFPRHSPEKQTIRLQLSLSKSLQLHRGPAHILMCILSLPLLHGGPVKHVPHACCLLLEELGVLSALLSPGRVERRGVLVHQVGVLCASRPTKVFHLCRKHKPEKIREPRDWREKETFFSIAWIRCTVIVSTALCSTRGSLSCQHMWEEVSGNSSSRSKTTV